jgi:hypothetical protein
MLVVTRGPAGCMYFTPDSSGVVPGFRVSPVDTTGAGDGYVAGLLAGLLDCDLSWEAADLERALRLGNAGRTGTTEGRHSSAAYPPAGRGFCAGGDRARIGTLAGFGLDKPNNAWYSHVSVCVALIHEDRPPSDDQSGRQGDQWAS